MSWRMTKLVALLGCLGCCSFVGGSGCSVHRTSEGFVLGSHWSLECSDRAPWLDFRQATAPGDTNGKPDAASAASGGAEANPPPDSPTAAEKQTVAAKPELLPWRSRLRAYRLAAHASPGQEAEAVSTASDDSTPETAATSSVPLSPPQATRPDPVIE